MDQASFIRVKLEFRKRVKLVKLDRRVDQSLSSVENLRRLIFKNFSEVGEMVEVRGANNAASLLLKCVDDAGGFVTIENDQDLEVARENSDEMRFQIEVIQARGSTVAAPAALTGWRSRPEASGSRWPQTSAKAKENYGPKDDRLCRAFGRGYCRNGPTCRFSHDESRVFPASSGLAHGNGRGRGLTTTESIQNKSTSQGLLFRDVREVDNWLMNQLELASGENIEQLSGEKGLRALSQVVAWRNLSSETITLFVKLLVKDEVRTSLLKHKTNKIYGVLLGSHFLLQLHSHVACHLGNPILAPKAPAVRPYLLLTEELQSRTADGWKEVPLDALHSVVLKLEENASKDELMALVSRLLDQRGKLQRLHAVAPPDKCLQGANFRQASIVPTKEELLNLQRNSLPVNRIGMQYSRVSDYLETHFQLLREDCVEPLRQGIKAYRDNCNHQKNGNAFTEPSGTGNQELRIYSGVQLFGIKCGDQGIEYVLSFDRPAREHDAQQWESSKKLMPGALLCVSSDQFQTFFWGVVARRDVKDLAKGLVAIRIMGESDPHVTAVLQSGRKSTARYVMVESTAAYFEAYYHVLKSLQREEMEEIPFTKYLLGLEPRVSPPSYLLRRKNGDEYDFSSVFPDIQSKLGRSTIRITQSEWPSGWADSLDVAQREALKQGLTKELAIIQGPPGTGKTFLGLILAQILLSNLAQNPADHDSNRASRWRHELGLNVEDIQFDIDGGPIFVVCYTNHALDQFLEGIYRTGETNLVRMGGRSKSNLLKERNLYNLLQKQRQDNEVEGIHRRLFGQGRFQKDDLECQIQDCINEMDTKYVSSTRLDGVATPDQIRSLFSMTGLGSESSKKIVEAWLAEAWFANPHLAHHFFGNGMTSSRSTEEDAKPVRGRTIPLRKADVTDSDGEWTEVRRGHRRRRAPNDGTRDDIAAHQMPAPRDGNEADDEYELQDFVDVPDVWELNLLQRRKLHEYWLDEIRMIQRRKLTELTQEYEETCKKLIEVENEIQLSLLRKAKVVGMTTTAAAKYHEVLKSLRPEIIIVEEAAEVLEGHILACLSPTVKHLILIGDHLQLRPSLAVYRLSTENKLDVSMFERLVKSGVEHVTLQEQRRMRPSISKLVRNLYPKSRDHECVTMYDSVNGVKSNTFFFDHKSGEDNVRDAASKVNLTEAKLVVELCLYLLNQGYKAEDIAILSMYTGQIVQIKALLSERCRNKWYRRPIGQSDGQDSGEEACVPRVSSVDDYQGEESEIIILSLVRSNAIVTNEGVGKIGFLRISNRICVALTRAKKGLFIFGNADLLAEKSTLWNQVITTMREGAELGQVLELYCQNHPDTITRISAPEDFKQVEDGGCSLPCEFQLECGHACPRRCHPGSHDLVVCPKPCLKKYADCPHDCNRRCHVFEDCPPCAVTVTTQMPDCGHQQGMRCSTNVEDEICHTSCPKRLECDHECKMLCGRPCTERCEEKVTKMLPCGHAARMPCYKDSTTHSCDEPCRALLQDCSHECRGSCGKCKQGTAHITCQQWCNRILPCGHVCQAGCSVSCPPCIKKCQKRCLHSRCSEPCGSICKPCQEKCSWQCDHHKCEKTCHEICTRPRCDLPCPKLIPTCGHRCIGLCGEPCPTKCRACHPKTLDVISQMTLDESEESDQFLQLQDCKHIFEVSGLDTWMADSDETSELQSVAMKACPECTAPIWKTHRYSNVVKKKHSQVEEVKKKVYGHEKTRQGNLLLDEGDYIGALSAFRQALQDNPGLMEAHYGTGCAFYVGSQYAKAITHLSFVVERSSFQSALANLIESTRGSGHAAGFVEKFYGSSYSKASNSIAMKAITIWAAVLTKTSDFTSAIKLCDAVLAQIPEDQLAGKVKDSAVKRELQVVVKALAADVGERGHWYTCPNGHYYTIGECGGAMQLSRCPDCKEQVGGGQHKLAAGNKHSNIDGSTQAAFPGN